MIMLDEPAETSPEREVENTNNLPRRNRSGQLIPVRRGSEYSDVLLRSLDNLLLQRAEPVVIGVVGCMPRQGATTTAVNLAIRAADHGRGPVLLIDGNAENRNLSGLYRCGRIGYGDCLAGARELHASVKNTEVRDLDVLGFGNRNLAGQFVADSNCASAFIADVRNNYRLSIVDLSPFANPSATASLCPYLDGIIAVARPSVPSSQLAELKSNIRQFHGNLLGVVMTGAQKGAMPKWLQRFFQ